MLCSGFKLGDEVDEECKVQVNPLGYSPHMKCNHSFGSCFFRVQLLKPSEKAQFEMILASLVEILFRLAEGRPIVFCIPGTNNCFEPTANFAIDGTTEKVDVTNANNTIM